MKTYHTPETAAQAVRAMFVDRIAITWEQYFEQARELQSIPPAQRGSASSSWLNSYQAAKLVQEQCNGPQKNEPVTFREASLAVETVIPELFAEYWERLPVAQPVLSVKCEVLSTEPFTPPLKLNHLKLKTLAAA
jgi:hypothetical protein